MIKAPVLYHFNLAGVITLAALLLLAGQSARGQNIFVVNGGAGTITQITPGGAQSPFASGLGVPTAIAFGNQGNLYVADQGTVYELSPAGARSTFVTLPYTGNFGMAFDASGNLYVANDLRYVSEYSPAGVGNGSLEYPSEIISIAFDAAGDLFTANVDANLNYPPISTPGIMERTPGYALTTFATEANQPAGIAFNNAGNLFVADYYAGDIYEYTPDGTQSVFATGLDKPYGLAFDSMGNLFVTDYGDGDITKITPDGTQSIFATGLGEPTDIAIEGQVLPVPEPSAVALAALAAAAFWFRRRQM